MCWSRPRSITFNISSAAIARSFSTTWMRWGSAVTCRFSFIRKVTPEKAAYFGHGMETYQTQTKTVLGLRGEHEKRRLGRRDAESRRLCPRGCEAKPRRVGAELAFVPADSAATLRKAVPDAEIKGCAVRARAIAVRKTPEELEKLRVASELVIDSMLAVIATPRRRRHQGGIERSAAPRGNKTRTDVRLLPDRRRLKPQPRSFRPALGEGRSAVARFRRQLSRLYRRSGAHGHRRRARRRA